MSNQKKSFWMSVPGVLTGVAAIISAITNPYLCWPRYLGLESYFFVNNGRLFLQKDGISSQAT